MSEQANNFILQHGSGGSSPTRGRRSASGQPQRKPNLQVRRTLRVKIKKSKPILGIAIEGGFNVSGQLLPRIVCVHVSSYAYYVRLLIYVSLLFMLRLLLSSWRTRTPTTVVAVALIPVKLCKFVDNNLKGLTRIVWPARLQVAGAVEWKC